MSGTDWALDAVGFFIGWCVSSYAVGFVSEIRRARRARRDQETWT